MGIHYDYKSKRGERAMLKESKRKARLAQKRAKRLLSSETIEEKEEDMIEFIRKIQNVKRKYFLLVINIDSHLDENKLSKLFENFEMIKFIKAGETKTLRIYQNKL